MNAIGSTTPERPEHGLRVATTRSVDDTLDLRYAVQWDGDGEPERFVVLLNGRTEWIEKYAYVAGDLRLPPGTALLTMDHRGQGGSGGARAFVESYDHYAADTRQVVEAVVGDRPYVVIAHSMGGLIGLYATLTGHLAPESMVLCSPLLGLPDDPVPRPLARQVAKLLTLCRLGAVSSGAGSFVAIPFADNQLTHNVDLYRRMQNSPYKIPGATFAWVAATFRALDTCFDPVRLAALKTPILVLAGSEESVVDPAAFQAWVQAATAHAPAKVRVQLRLIAGARHELLSEIPDYYGAALAEIRSWFNYP